eukprot:m.53622 g.53622  ORF g.53622 m.53622 type:complete len:257 (+) comp9161_c0_seq2:109-879(+)
MTDSAEAESTPTEEEVDLLISRLERRQSSGPIEDVAELTCLSSVGGLTPLTVYQILTATGAEEPGDKLLVNQREITFVSIVCRVVRLQVEGSTTIMRLADHTATVAAIHTPIGSTSNDAIPYQHGYVTVVGRVRGPNSTRRVDVDSIRPLNSSNELTTHLLSVIHTNLLALRGQPPPQELPQSSPTAGLLSSIQQRVIAACRCAPMEGLTTMQVVDALGDHAHSEEVRSTLQWLCSEGLIYTTITDDHWKAEEWKN